MKRIRRSMLSVCVLVLCCAGALGQAGIGAGSPPPASPAQAKAPEVAAPEHPVTEATLRRYFEVCHYDVHNREVLEAQFEQQRKELPPWYPGDLWTDTVDAILNIDHVEVALPVYQKYWSEEGAQKATLLVVTPAGQAMVRKEYATSLAKVEEGDSAAEARRKAVAEAQAREDEEIRKMLNSMTPKQEREVEAFMRSAEWKRMDALSAQLYNEVNVASLAKQQEVAHAVALQHQEELRKALKEYKAAHPGYDPAKPTDPK